MSASLWRTDVWELPPAAFAYRFHQVERDMHIIFYHCYPTITAIQLYHQMYIAFTKWKIGISWRKPFSQIRCWRKSYALWVNPSRQLSSTQLLTPSCPAGQGGESVGVSCPHCVPPSFLSTPCLLGARTAWEAEVALTLCKHCSGTAEHQCVISTVLVTDPKHRPMPAAVEKINSIPARTSMLCHQT